MKNIIRIMTASLVVLFSAAFSSAASADVIDFNGYDGAWSDPAWGPGYVHQTILSDTQIFDVFYAPIQRPENNYFVSYIGYFPNVDRVNSWFEVEGYGQLSFLEFDTLAINSSPLGGSSGNDWAWYWQGQNLNVTAGHIVYGAPAVPEPETYAMLLAGLGLLGVIARRRRKAARQS
ncbi:MAG: PEP-CTERM sorting domain-containing protein [Zoogloeaceae bacterium]|jgi:hypothetical protein|nr:PEP-CTERM sorting domain-containing protein [Zoogloeaceae bacterium]